MDRTSTIHQEAATLGHMLGQPPGSGRAIGAVPEISRSGWTPLKESIPWADEEGQEDADRDHLRCLKVVAEKMRLQTRRPSYLEWLSFVEQQPPLGTAHRALAALSAPCGPPWAPCAAAGPRPVSGTSDPSGGAKGNGGSKEARVVQWQGGDIGQTLTWLRRQLVEMRVQDQQLARALVTVQDAVSRLKVARLLGSPCEDGDAGTAEKEEGREGAADVAVVH